MGADEEEEPSRAVGPAPRDVVPVPAPAMHLDRAPREREPEPDRRPPSLRDDEPPQPSPAVGGGVEQQHLLDVVLFVFGGVILIFAMEQMVQLGIQLGARDGL